MNMVGIRVRDLSASKWVSLVGNEFRYKGHKISLPSEGLEGDKVSKRFWSYKTRLRDVTTFK